MWNTTRSILGILLIDIFGRWYIFVGDERKSETCNFTDNDTLYSCGKHVFQIKQNLIYKIPKCFRISSLKSNTVKFEFIVLGDKTSCKYILEVNSKSFEASEDVTLLGVAIDKHCAWKVSVLGIFLVRIFRSQTE